MSHWSMKTCCNAVSYELMTYKTAKCTHRAVVVDSFHKLSASELHGLLELSIAGSF